MIAPLLLTLLSAAGLAAALLLPGWRDALLVAAPSLIAALWLLSRARRAPRRRKAQAQERLQIVVDGSNVLHWAEGQPDLAPLLALLAELDARGYQPGVIFDANAGYKLRDRYLDDRALARLLGLPVDRVMVAAKGSPADPLILQAARDLGARVVSNDRFRDWAGAYPEVRNHGQLVRGSFEAGRLSLLLPDED